MKLKNAKVGMRVVVKVRKDTSAAEHVLGKQAVITATETSSYTGNLSVKVKTDTGDVDWMSHKDIRKLRDGEI